MNIPFTLKNHTQKIKTYTDEPPLPSPFNHPSPSSPIASTFAYLYHNKVDALPKFFPNFCISFISLSYFLSHFFRLQLQSLISPLLTGQYCFFSGLIAFLLFEPPLPLNIVSPCHIVNMIQKFSFPHIQFLNSKYTHRMLHTVLL